MSVDVSIKLAAQAIDDAESIGIVCHVGPDGDALGSALGLAVAARAAGKDVTVSFGEPFVVPGQFSFLPTELLVSPNDFAEGLDVVVSCDAATLDRLGNLAGKATSAGTLIVVDHHASNGGFGDVQVIDPRAAATAELIAILLAELGWHVDEAAARCLYTGLVTDTGRFQYSNTSPAVLRLAADLLGAGVRPELVGQKVYEEVPFAYLQVASAVTGRAELDADLGLVTSVLYLSDLADAGLRYEDADGLIDLIRIATEASVACLLREVDGGTKGSIRSRGAVDVGAVAIALGGGGHHNAAGFMLDMPPDEAREALVAALRRTR